MTILWNLVHWGFDATSVPMPKQARAKKGKVGVMQDDIVPVLAYEGMQSEVVFLQTMLEASGITCSIDQPIHGTRSFATRDSRLFVAQSDMDAAAPLIADFREQGAKSSS